MKQQNPITSRHCATSLDSTDVSGFFFVRTISAFFSKTCTTFYSREQNAAHDPKPTLNVARRECLSAASTPWDSPDVELELSTSLSPAVVPLSHRRRPHGGGRSGINHEDESSTAEFETSVIMAGKQGQRRRRDKRRRFQ